jgi:nifR3 family TIM-barrel protein
MKSNNNKNFWLALPKPFFVCAPMANVTDSAFRNIIAKYGKPDVMWTEFVSADGLVSPGRENLIHDLRFSKKERPIVAQLFTGHTLAMEKASALVVELGFDGLDINMGCPDRSVEKQGGGAALIKDYKKAISVIESARIGSKGLPVSVKTRIGYNKVDFIWLQTLLEQRLPALTVHLRTRKEMSDVPAHWELMPEIVKMRDEISPETLIMGNGDVLSLEDALDKIGKYGCDGVMIGRGIFGTPWFFSGIEREMVDGKSLLKINEKQIRSPKQRLSIMLEHAKTFDKHFRGIKNFAVMKKHFKAYVSGWDGAKDLRNRLMETEKFSQVKKIVDEYIEQF